MNAALEVMPITGALAILVALGLSTATFYRQRRPAKQATPRPTPARALSDAERRAIRDTLNSDRFVDQAPAEVVATLLEEGTYLASERTMYRVLAENNEVKERRNQLRHPEYKKPELVATAPNQVWSWDVTKLMTHIKFVYLHLYVMLDIFSRYVVGWLLADHENATYAKRLIDETYAKHNVKPDQLVLHSDRGSPMRSLTLAQLLATLDVRSSFSRPHVSDDNPFSESAFKTLKYHPTFPRRFGSLHDGMPFCESYFRWYNHNHHHSGIEYLTPYQVHYRQADVVLERRHGIMMDAWRMHPERFIHGPPRRAQLSPAVFINPPPKTTIDLHTQFTSEKIVANFTKVVSQNA